MDNEPIATYSERQPGWRRQLSLYPGRIVIVASKPFGNDYVIPISLAKVDPEYSIIRVRKQIAGAGSLILGGMFVFLFVFGMYNGRPEFFPYGAIVTGAFALVCFCVGILNLGKFEHYMFRFAGGRMRSMLFVPDLIAIVSTPSLK